MNIDTLVAVVFSTLFLATAALFAGIAVYVYIDATRRNVPEAWLWALGTMFTGPCALIAYLIDRPKAPQVICQFCGKTALETDPQCPYCGRELDDLGRSIR